MKQFQRSKRTCLAIVAMTLAVPAAWAGGAYQEKGQEKGQEKEQEGPPSEDLRAGGDESKRYFLIGADEERKAPRGGYKLLLVLPGGDGSADFHPFVKRIYENALSEEYLVAQLVAPKWSEDQFDSVVWPTAHHEWPKMEFTTEQFAAAVVEDVEKRFELDEDHIHVLAWSSGGPAAYAMSLDPATRTTGFFVAMSVFKPDQLPALEGAKGLAYYIFHSPEDFIPIAMAEDARAKLSSAKAEVELERYSGGHGWKGDVYGNIRKGISWLDEHAKERKRKR